MARAPRQARECRTKGCEAYAINGGVVCAAHGGRAPQVAAKAEVRAEIARFELEGHETADPGDTLLMMISAFRSKAIECAKGIQEMVNRHNGDLNKALVSDVYITTSDGDTVKTGESVRGLVDLEIRYSDRVASWSALAIKAGLEERRVKLAERQGELIAQVLRSVMRSPALALSQEQRDVLPLVIEQAWEELGG
jgi:hypothetical protein